MNLLRTSGVLVGPVFVLGRGADRSGADRTVRETDGGSVILTHK